MNIERLRSEMPGHPFPIHGDLVERFTTAHGGEETDGNARDPALAHALAVCCGFSYADAQTMGTMMSRVGIAANACVSIHEAVTAMQIFSTVFLVQSPCGRVVVLCYRGTEGSNLGSWLGDYDYLPETMRLGPQHLHVHAGFHRNHRATRLAILKELAHAADGRSLANPTERVDHPLEALYVCGHSLGGALAVLFAIGLAADPDSREIAERLRAVYTFGQPMLVVEPIPDVARFTAERIFRHVYQRDVIPALPPADWAPFVHLGHEYVYSHGEWLLSDAPTAQARTMGQVSRSLLAMLGPRGRREAAPYHLRDHGPHHYIAALRPKDRVTEFGDFG